MSGLPLVPLFPFVVLGLILFQIKLRKSSSKLLVKKTIFLEREQKANYITKRSLPSDIYIKTNAENLPFVQYNIDENDIDALKIQRIVSLQNKVKTVIDRKMICFPQELTNTQLKEMYGINNLEIIISCEQNYNNYIHLLNNWAKALFDANDFINAEKVVKEAIFVGSDTSFTYNLLLDIYFKWDKAKFEKFKTEVFTIDVVACSEFMKDKISDYISENF